ncbi:TPA: hypothetical protein I8Y12_004498 [Raoultella planticola]|nr:hypothetical protein [Raoultella planticola]
MNKLVGINTGIIKSATGVLAMALKVRSASDAESLIYLPPDRLQSLLFAVFSGYRQLQMMFQEDAEGIREQVIAQSEALNSRIPVVTLDEVQQPDIALRTIDFVMKSNQERVTFLFFLQNDSVVAVDLALTQMEYLLGLLLTTIQKTEDREFISLALRENDFIPFYTVDFMSANGEGVKYNQFNVPSWKSAALDDFYSLLIVQDNGDIPCGIIIKAVAGLEPSRANEIAELLLNNNSLLISCQQQTITFEYEKMDPATTVEERESLLRAHIKHRQAKIDLSAR